MTTKKKYAKPFFQAQERMRENWLSKKPEYPHQTRCLWQTTKPIEGTIVEALECWLIGNDLYIVELCRNGGFCTFKMEDNKS